MFQELLTLATLNFFLVSLLNVLLSTAKSVLTIKGTRLTATLMNAISYTVYAAVTKNISEAPLEISLIVIFVTNILGVYTTLFLLDKLEKERVWKISMIMNASDFYGLTKEMENADIGYNAYDVSTKYGEDKEVKAFLKTKSQSKEMKKIIKKYDSVKYSIVELNKSL